MPKDDLERIRAVTGRVVRSHGLDLFDVRLRRESAGWVLRVTIDRPAAVEGPSPPGEDSVSIQDCEQISRDLSAVLDVEDPLDRTYILEVSSPGLDRPLRQAADYRRFAGRLARIVVSEAIDGQTFLSGRLRGLEDAIVLLEGSGGRLHRIPLEAITRARLDVEF